MPFGFPFICRCCHRTAHLMPHHDDKRTVEMKRSVFDAGELGVAGDVARHPDVEEIAEPLIEDDLGRDA